MALKMVPTTDWWEKNMGRGGAIPLKPRPVQEQKNSSGGNPIAESDTQQEVTEVSKEEREEIMKRVDERFRNALPVTIDQG